MKKIYFLFALLLSVITANAADIAGGTKLYLNPGVWNVDGAWFSAYYYGANGNGWASGTQVDGSDYYEFTAPDGTWTNVIFVRNNPASTALSWDSKWNQTEDLTYDGTKNLCTITAWGNGTDVCLSSWSVYAGVTYPEALYIVGFDGSWVPENPTVISGADGVYTAKNLVFTNSEFKLSKAKGDWNAFNGGCLYMGTITVGEEVTITSGDGNNSIATGTYDVTINLITKTFKATVPTTTGVEETLVGTDAAVEYFNLQGVKVANPENGIFIKKQGSKAVKVVL